MHKHLCIGMPSIELLNHFLVGEKDGEENNDRQSNNHP